jgi:uncharacterized protein DUF1801
VLRDLDQYYLNKEEPTKSCLQALRDYILNYNESIAEAWKYRMPFFIVKGKMFCYLWTDKKTGLPYMGFVEGSNMDHPLLEQGNRKRMKILRIDPTQDLPIETIDKIMQAAIGLYP